MPCVMLCPEEGTYQSVGYDLDILHIKWNCKTFGKWDMKVLFGNVAIMWDGFPSTSEAI